jgi:hypothetical protein
VYNTVVRLCQFFCCGQKANLVQFFLLNPIFLLVHRNKLSVTVYLFLALYGSTTIQSRSFLKMSRTLFDFQINTNWVSLLKKHNLLIFRTGVSCFSVILFYSTLLALTHRQNHRQRVKSPRYAWAGGTFFQLCCCVRFLFWWEKGFGITYSLCT